MSETRGESPDRGRRSRGPLADVGKAFLQTHGPPESHLESHHLTRQEIYTRSEKEKAFSDIASIVKDYSKELVERWSSEIETYLVYAGLFSAILTAFNVESYQLLESPSPDSTAAILERISLQISSLSYAPPFVNSTHSAFDSSQSGPVAPADIPRWAIWLNMLWFSSLVLSLSSASIGILVKQWLNEFQSGLSGDSERVAKLRQYRFNNLERCHIGAIVNAIPVLLQAALSLFLAGLLVLLWNLNRTVAAVTSLFVLAIAIFIIGTTVAPLMTASCAYLSSQSLFLYTAWPYAMWAIHKPLWAVKLLLLKLFGKALSNDIRTERQPSFQSWVGREHETVGTMSQELEVDMCRTAYRATLQNDVIVSATVRVFDWDVDSAFAWLSQLQDIDISHFGTLQDHLQGGQAVTEAVFYGYILLCSMVDPAIVRGRFFIRSGLTPEEVAQRFHNCFGNLKGYAPPASDERHDRWSRQVSWILTTYAVLYEGGLEHRSDQQSAPLPVATCIAELTRPLESPRLVLMAMIIGTGAAQLEHQRILLLKLSGVYASIAFQELQSSASSIKTSSDYLRMYLRTQALLLYAVAIRPPRTQGSLLDKHEHESEDERQREQERDDFDNGVKDALADLSKCFQRLACSNLAGPRKHIVAARLGVFLRQRAIIDPLSHIVRTLSLKLDVFRLVLPKDFVTNLEALLCGMEQSGFFKQRFWTHVPWNEGGRWYPPDLYDATQDLLKKLCNAAGPSRDGSAPQVSNSRGNDPPQQAASHPTHQSGGNPPLRIIAEGAPSSPPPPAMQC